MTYGKRTLIAVDQLLNTLLGGWPDETLSSRCYRWARDGVRVWPRRVVDGLFFWQREHCKSSYESEREGRQSPPELRHAKERRALSVSSAVVEIDGLEFDASLDSIYRMNAVLFAAQLDAKPDSAVVRDGSCRTMWFGRYRCASCARRMYRRSSAWCTTGLKSILS